MGADSKIEWTDHTFNPWTGCERISPGCDNCYAEAWAQRAGHPERWQGRRHRTSVGYWRQPLKWDREAAAAGRRERVFCASLADVFDNTVPAEWRSDLFKLIEATPNLDWLLLTKRIGNVKAMTGGVSAWPNVWLGATICNQEEADRDIPKLLATPASIRFLSIEPMLGPIDLRRYLIGHEVAGTPFTGARTVGGCEEWIPPVNWVIVGGESGPMARPMHPAWARSVRDQCAAAGTPFLFKQWGEYLPGDQPEIQNWSIEDERAVHEFAAPGTTDADWALRVGKKAAGRQLDGRTHDELPVPA
jgi:protein gp37